MWNNWNNWNNWFPHLYTDAAYDLNAYNALARRQAGETEGPGFPSEEPSSSQPLGHPRLSSRDAFESPHNQRGPPRQERAPSTRHPSLGSTPAPSSSRCRQTSRLTAYRPIAPETLARNFQNARLLPITHSKPSRCRRISPNEVWSSLWVEQIRVAVVGHVPELHQERVYPTRFFVLHDVPGDLKNSVKFSSYSFACIGALAGLSYDEVANKACNHYEDKPWEPSCGCTKSPSEEDCEHDSRGPTFFARTSRLLTGLGIPNSLYAPRRQTFSQKNDPPEIFNFTYQDLPDLAIIRANPPPEELHRFSEEPRANRHSGHEVIFERRPDGTTRIYDPVKPTPQNPANYTIRPSSGFIALKEPRPAVLQKLQNLPFGKNPGSKWPPRNEGRDYMLIYPAPA